MRLSKPVLVAFLLCLAGVARVAAGPETSAQVLDREVFTDWDAALRASAMELNQVHVLTPLSYEHGVALYRIEGMESGEVAHALVALPFDPTIVPAEAPALEMRADEDEATPGLPDVMSRLAFGGLGSCRCWVYCYKHTNYGTLLFYTNLDWNALKEYSGFNDSISSLRTTCNEVYFFEHTNWLGSILHVPPNTSLPNLKDYNFNDKISALWHINF